MPSPMMSKSWLSTSVELTFLQSTVVSVKSSDLHLYTAPASSLTPGSMRLAIQRSLLVWSTMMPLGNRRAMSPVKFVCKVMSPVSSFTLAMSSFPSGACSASFSLNMNPTEVVHNSLVLEFQSKPFSSKPANVTEPMGSSCVRVAISNTQICPSPATNRFPLAATMPAAPVQHPKSSAMRVLSGVKTDKHPAFSPSPLCVKY
mmetsp:Transcript_1529/g.3088  ORF Transcript_1529/g.3088 Transcript_1529/m.3088 type:complete len:202 (-) Transcript_1529:480-1085(-)